ncbi:MAG: 5-methylcytosine-specific restriction endonuclease McrA [Candidatus Aldehydirespiratoraceae bacterium]|jgi:5-methylcytosine-specific restriction endonuclease McrA
MSGVLVLNATFEPLAVVPIRRAICLMLDEKVELLHSSGRRVRSEWLALDEPSVVRLSRYVHVPYPKHRSPNRPGVLARDGGTCQYCGAVGETIDHVLPRSRGGRHTWDNVVAACRRCNSTKRDRLLVDTTMRLARVPGPPPPSTWIEVAAGSVPLSWAPYLTAERRSA